MPRRSNPLPKDLLTVTNLKQVIGDTVEAFKDGWDVFHDGDEEGIKVLHDFGEAMRRLAETADAIRIYIKQRQAEHKDG
jgi:hypothetical protein